MGLRDKLKKREEKRDQAANGGINAGLPEGVTRYVRQATELKEGKDFVILRDPNLWYFYYVHEDGDYATRSTYVKKHTCLHSPRKAPDTEKEADEMFTKFEKKGPKECISCKAKAKRVLYFMIPVYDVEYDTWRVLDMKEFHINNMLNDIDKAEKAARKFNKGYSMIGDLVTVSKADKTFTVSGSDIDEEDIVEAILAKAGKIDQSEINYEELANFRDEDDIISLLRQADGSKIDKKVLPKEETAEETKVDDSSEPVNDDMPAEDDLGF